MATRVRSNFVRRSIGGAKALLCFDHWVCLGISIFLVRICVHHTQIVLNFSGAILTRTAWHYPAVWL
jgi:hypothetical protein